MIAPYREEPMVPAEYDVASAGLVPMVRERWQVVPAITSPAGLPHVVVGEHLAVVVAFQGSHGLVPIDHDMIAAWGRPIGEVVQQAVAHAGSLRATIDKLSGSGRAYRVSGSPAAVAALLQSPNLLSEVTVNGAPLVMPANPECLYVTGDYDTAGKRTLLRAATDLAGRQGCFVGHGLRLEQESWKPWLPTRSHYLYVGLQSLAFGAAWRRYAAQNEALIEGRYDSHPPGECFVSSLIPIRDPATGAPQTIATWSKGVRCLLPRIKQHPFCKSGFSEVGHLASMVR